MDKAAKATAEAVMDPQNQRELYRPVKVRRWRGCAVSAINSGAAVCDMPSAIPVTVRAAKNTQWL